MFHSKRSSFFITLGLLILNALSCAPADTVTITLLPSIGLKHKKFHELHEEFFQQKASSFFNVLNSSNSCRQMHVRTVFAQGEGNNGGTLATFPVTTMRTLIPTPTPPIPYDDVWLNTSGNVEFEAPLKINVPKGVYVEIGLFGSLNLPTDGSPDDDVCDNIVAGIPQTSYAIMGHKPIGSTTTSLTVPLKVFMFKSDPSPTPTPPNYSNGQPVPNIPTSGIAGGYFCSASDFEHCPVRDIVEIKNYLNANVPSYCKIIKVRYFHGVNGTPPIEAVINDGTAWGTTRHYFFPNSPLYEIVVQNNSNVALVSTILTGDNNVLTGANLPASVCNTDGDQTISIGKPGQI